MLAKFKNIDLKTGEPWKVILLFSIPFILTSLLNILFTLVDSTIIGQIIPEAYAGVSDVGSVYTYIVVLANACGVGFSSVIANYFGKNDENKVRTCFKKTIIFSVILAIIGTICFVFAADSLLKLLGLSPDKDYITYQSAKVYFLVMIIGFPITMGQVVYINALRGLGKSTAPFIFLSIASLINILITFLFVKYFDGIDNKVMGAAIATLASQLIAIVLTRIYVYKKFPYLNSTKKSDFDVNDELSKELFSTAFPLIIQNLAIAISMFIISKGIVEFDNQPGKPVSTDVQIAKDLSNKVMSITNNIEWSITAAFMYFVGQNNGAKKYTRIKKGLKQVFIMLFVFYLIQLMFSFGLTYNCGFAYLLVDASKINDNTKLTIHIFTMAYSSLYFIKIVTDTLTKYLIGLEKPIGPLLATIAELPFRFLIVYGIRFWCFSDPYSFGALILVAFAEPLTWLASASVLSIGTLNSFKSFKHNSLDPCSNG